jgi:threonine synthase
MIQSALERGDIRAGTKLIEATSGNTGIALAMIARLFNLEIELVMPSNSTRERTVTMEAFGAKVILLDSIEACRDYAEEKSASGDYFLLNQFANPDNYLAHYKTTAPEIWRDTNGGYQRTSHAFRKFYGNHRYDHGRFHVLKREKGRHSDHRLPTNGRVFHTRYQALACRISTQNI